MQEEELKALRYLSELALKSSNGDKIIIDETHLNRILEMLKDFSSSIEVIHPCISFLVHEFPPVLMHNCSHELILSTQICYKNCNNSIEFTESCVHLICVIIQFGDSDTMNFILDRLDSFRFDELYIRKILRRMFVTLTHWGLAKTYISNIEKILSRCYSRAECLHDNEELLELNHDVIEALNKKKE